MTDLHCHILPDFDDGAASLEEAISLLRKEIAGGVDTVVLTPHFYIEREPLADFLARREAAYEDFKEKVKSAGFGAKLLLGAEVAFSPLLQKEDITPLCIEGSNTMLLELPTLYNPKWLKEICYSFQLEGITPLLAHIERCPYLVKDSKILVDMIYSGMYTQVNAGSLLGGGKQRREIVKLIKHHLVHVIATDTHSLDRRPPRLGEAMEVVRRKLGGDMADEMVLAAESIAANTGYESPEPVEIRTLFGGR